MTALTSVLVRFIFCVVSFANVSIDDSSLLVCLMFCGVSNLFVKCFCFFFVGDFLYVFEMLYCTSVSLCMRFFTDSFNIVCQSLCESLLSIVSR